MSAARTAMMVTAGAGVGCAISNIEHSPSAWFTLACFIVAVILAVREYKQSTPQPHTSEGKP